MASKKKTVKAATSTTTPSDSNEPSEALKRAAKVFASEVEKSVLHGDMQVSVFRQGDVIAVMLEIEREKIDSTAHYLQAATTLDFMQGEGLD